MELNIHNNDNDLNPLNLAATSKGGWWYDTCQEVNLNGVQYSEGPITTFDGIIWNGYTGLQYSLGATIKQIGKD